MANYQFLYTPIGGPNGKVPPLKDWTVGTVIEKSEMKVYQTPRNPVYAIGLYLKTILGLNPDPEVSKMTLEAWAKKRMSDDDWGDM